ncbi:MAG: hypothetical protein ACRDJH_05860 [Thermomicrobiales bacterium]
MAQRATIDATNIPALRSVADEVRKSQEPIVLQTDGEDVAIVLPLDTSEPRSDFKPTPEQIAAIRSAFGAWKGLVDADELKARIKASRGSNRPIYKL